MDLTSAGHQPMGNPQTGDWLIFNGEIYNFREIRARSASACGLESKGDTAVLLWALSERGEAVLDDLDGMFALAFYQSRSGRLLLARDHLGVKPLYIGIGRNAFVFGSEVRSILASGLVPDDLDPGGVAGFLAYGAPQDPLTVHRNVFSLPAGTCRWVGAEVCIGGQSAPIRRYWRFPQSRGVQPPDQAARCVRDLLAASVEKQCVADVPLGAFLSGGIDSAAVVALAQGVSPPIDTLAVGFDCLGGADESEAAASTAHALGTRHRQTIIDKDWILPQWSQWMKASDRPSVDGLNTYIISGAMRDLDISVALSGLGGDELFCGYGSFVKVPSLHRVLTRVRWVPSHVRRALGHLAGLRLSPSKRLKAATIAASAIDPVSLTLKLRRLAADSELESLGLRQRELGLTEDYLAPAALEAVDATADAITKVSETELTFYMGNTLLRDADVFSMAHSLELRVPFLGRTLVDAVTSMPGQVRSPPKVKPKHVLREAMRDIVPSAVFTRPKSGFTLPIGEWMTGPLRADAEAAVAELANCSMLCGDAVRRLWTAYTCPTQSLHWSRAMSLVALGSYLIHHRERCSRLPKTDAAPG